MKNYTALILILALSGLSCKGQNKISDKLLGTWEETHRDYVYQTKATEYEFTKAESIINKGEKLVFTQDTLFHM